MTAEPDLRRKLGVRDGILLTIGSVVGSGIFLTPAAVATALPHAGLVVVAWILGGLVTLAGAFTMGELGALFPRAGGMYHYLKEAYGPLPAFLFGWTAFLVIMSGGIAAIAVGFGASAGTFVPWLSKANVAWSVPLGPVTWTVDGRQIAAVLAILVLTVVNHFGVGSGVALQNVLTVTKVVAIAALVAGTALVPARVVPDYFAPVPAGAWLALAGTAMIAVLWTYDGWNAVCYSAGELKDPGKTLPRSIVAGTAAVVLLYVALNVAYLRALPLDVFAASSSAAEDTARAAFSPAAARLVAAAIAISMLGCLASTILYSSRIYYPMAKDGVFFHAVAKVHPRWRVPHHSLWLQSAWAIVLALSGTYEELVTYVTFAVVLFGAAAASSVFVLRRTRPYLARPYRAWGYPVVPSLFILASAILLVNAVVETPRESLAGLVIVLLGIPAFLAWHRRGRPTPGPRREASA